MDESPTDGFRHHPWWLAAVAGLLVAQAGLGLGLFGPGHRAAALLDDRPVLAGRHPLHLYHGTLGARTFHDTGGTACYDPAFQAGYPKTPVFDSGCRPAELFLILAGGTYSPAAYKVGMFLLLLAAPPAFVLAGRGAGLPAGAACLAGVGGILLVWSPPVRALLADGDLDVFAAGLAAVVFVAWLARYSKWFGVDSWAVLAGSAAAGWYAHPLVWAALVPVVAVFYLVVAPRHGLAWHLGLVGLSAAGLAPNLWWLTDWGRYWWLRLPSQSDAPLPHLAEILGGPADYWKLFAGFPGVGFLPLVGLAGLGVMWRSGHRAAVGLVLLGVVTAVLLGRLGAVWPPVKADGLERVVPLAAAFLAGPVAAAAWAALSRVKAAAPVTVAAVAAVAVLGWADGPTRPLARLAGLDTTPLPLGLTADQQEVVQALAARTTPDARILWDEPLGRRPGWNWSALLPLLTDRAFIGGLDPDAGVEHAFCGMRGGKLNGRPLDQWTDAELGAFCRRYNVGWVAARSAAAVGRWGRLPMAKPVARLTDDGTPLVLFELTRPRSFVLSGTARWEEATTRHVCLTDVVPGPDGAVELSLHHQQGWRVYPSYIQVASAADADDPIWNLKLLLPGPVPLVTLVWENQ